MSTSANEVKTITTEAQNLAGDASKATSQVETRASAELSSVRARVASLEMHIDALYAKHTRLTLGVLAAVIALIVWRIV